MVERNLPRVAVVDGDPRLRALLIAALQPDGFEVRAAADAAAGLALVRSWRPDVIVLDVDMPSVDGMEALHAMRRATQAPILVLSARGDVGDRVAGLDGGADDYLVKPVAVVELAARLHSALRRSRLHRADVLRFADLELDAASRSARRAGRPIPLSTREYVLLATLIRRPRRVFTRAELLTLVWGPDRVVSANTVEAFISLLRAKIDRPDDLRLIHTVRGVGYRLDLPG